MRPLVASLVLLVVAGCFDRTPEPVAPSTPAPNVSFEVRARDTESTPAPEPGASRSDASRVLVLQTTKLDRYAEVIGVVDVHEAMGSDQAALQRLREKAAAMGADAVVGVEFHHGEGEGEPTHLSGMAVRFVPASSLPSEEWPRQ